MTAHEHDDTPRPPDQETVARGHETTAVPSRWLVIAGFVLLALVGVALGVATGIGAGFGVSDTPSDTALVEPEPTPRQAPRLEPNQALEFQELRAREEQRLSEYAWVDRDAGIARIPVERAIDWMAEHGTTLPQAEAPSQ